MKIINHKIDIKKTFTNNNPKVWLTKLQTKIKKNDGLNPKILVDIKKTYICSDIHLNKDV